MQLIERRRHWAPRKLPNSTRAGFPRTRRTRDPKLSESQLSANVRCCLSTVTLHYAPGQAFALGYFSAAVKYGSAQTREQVLVKLSPMRSVSMIRPSDLLVTNETLRGRERVTNRRAEIAALDALALILADDPHRALQQLLDYALRLYGAGSAGLSVLQPGSCGHSDLVWEEVSGALAAHRGDGTPRNFSPCGLCLDIGAAIVLARPERVFTYLARIQPAILEALIAPLYDTDGAPLGALWVVHHDPTACFGSNDVRAIERLAAPMVLAVQRARQSDRSRAVGCQ